ncbi:MAG: zinc ribbon domain-containing protein [Coriobacteriia bacterium]|nr:zinc ribbon domain-containing protein [Coriobacteriia bacterium]
MNCPTCGAVNNDNAQFCDDCAAPFAFESAPADASPRMSIDPPADAAAAGDDDLPGYRLSDSVNVELAGAAPSPYMGEPEESDPFFKSRMEERAYWEKLRSHVEDAGGGAAYAQQLQESLEASRVQRHKHSVFMNSIGLGVTLVALMVVVWASLGWVHKASLVQPAAAAPIAAVPGAVPVTKAAPRMPVTDIGGAVGVAIVMLVSVAALGTFASRLGRKTLWGVLAALIFGAAEGALVMPYMNALPAGGPAGSGLVLGAGVFVFAALIGGLAGAWYGGSWALD